MKNKWNIIFCSAALLSCHAFANDQQISIKANKKITQVVNWTSNNSADILSIHALGTYFTVHLSVASGSLSSISFTCPFHSPIVITPGSNVVCFVDNGSTVTWESATGSAATGTYEILPQV